MSHKKERTSNNNHHLHVLSAEVRLNRIHRLFKNQYNVTEPSLILEPYLFLGNCISAQDINRLSKLGIRYVMNVAIRDVEVCPYYSDDIRVHTIDLRDDDRENIIRAFDQAFNFIDEAKRNKSRVLIHCSHGQSRSPAIVVAYLMRTYNVSLEQCLIHVIKARPCVSPNDGFLKQLILFDRFLVDRRRKREQAAAAAAPVSKQVTEIPIQHRETNGKTLDETCKTPTKSDSETTNTKSGSSSTNSSNQLTNGSEESIHIVPIQTINRKTSNSTQVQPNSNKRISLEERKSIDGNRPTRDLSSQNRQSKNRSTLDITASNSKDEFNLKSNDHTTIIGRSKSARPERIRPHLSSNCSHHQKQYNQASSEFTDSFQTETTYYAVNHGMDGSQTKKTHYITEIYDRATNRFILAES